MTASVLAGWHWDLAPGEDKKKKKEETCSNPARFTHFLCLPIRVGPWQRVRSLLPIHMAVFPGAAPDQAPLYQQRSRRKDKKRKTQAKTTSKLFRGRDQAVWPGLSTIIVSLSHFFFPRHLCVIFFCSFPGLSRFFGRDGAAAVCALPSQASNTGGLQEWEGPEWLRARWLKRQSKDAGSTHILLVQVYFLDMKCSVQTYFHMLGLRFKSLLHTQPISLITLAYPGTYGSILYRRLLQNGWFVLSH